MASVINDIFGILVNITLADYWSKYADSWDQGSIVFVNTKVLQVAMKLYEYDVPISLINKCL